MVLPSRHGEWFLGCEHDRTGETSFGLVTPLELFEWLRMPFGLKNTPQIYQLLLDNALYGFSRIPQGAEPDESGELFTSGKPYIKLGLLYWVGGRTSMTIPFRLNLGIHCVRRWSGC